MDSLLSTFFGPQERSKGAELLRKDLVFISSASDTDVRALVKSSVPCRVKLTADQVAAPSFASTCTCPASRKGDLCKHTWAVLLKLEEMAADFLEGKVEVLNVKSQTVSAADQARQAKRESFKIQQRQRQKERTKDIRKEKKRHQRGPRFTYPPAVQEAIDFFRANGFPLEEINMPQILNARKILARVFHPDKGGAHEEVLALNANFEILEDYLKS